MIIVHRLNGAEFAINSELIETVEENPDTTITLVGRRRFLVAETVDEIIDAVTAYRRSVAGAPFAIPNVDGPDGLPA
ncbi:MAG: flagellar FlbD family protein [Miltoncostaeaceae bacterium]